MKEKQPTAQQPMAINVNWQPAMASNSQPSSCVANVIMAMAGGSMMASMAMASLASNDNGNVQQHGMA